MIGRRPKSEITGPAYIALFVECHVYVFQEIGFVRGS